MSPYFFLPPSLPFVGGWMVRQAWKSARCPDRQVGGWCANIAEHDKSSVGVHVGDIRSHCRFPLHRVLFQLANHSCLSRLLPHSRHCWRLWGWFAKPFLPCPLIDVGKWIDERLRESMNSRELYKWLVRAAFLNTNYFFLRAHRMFNWMNG